MEDQKMTTVADQEASRMVALAEVGIEPPCPFCGKPRVSRSSYIRCQPCGKNWLNEEMNLRDYLNRNPSAARWEAAHTGKETKPTVGQ